KAGAISLNDYVELDGCTVYGNSHVNRKADIVINNNEADTLVLKGASSIDAVDMPAGKTVIVASNYSSDPRTKMYTDDAENAFSGSGATDVGGSFENGDTGLGVGVYTVTLDDGVEGAETASKGTDYSFTAELEEGSLVVVTVGGARVTVNVDGGTYTVPGALITGAIVIDVLAPDELAASVGGTNYATLPDAIDAANELAASGAVTVTLLNDTTLSESVTLAATANAITLDGAGKTLNFASTARIVVDGTAEVKNAAFVGTERAVTPVEVRASSTLTLSGIDASGFIGDYNGGVAFVNTGAKLIAKNCAFSGNAGRNGGVIYMADGASNGAVMLEADGCSFTNNRASSHGGAIFGMINTKTNAAIIKNSTFEGNRADNLTRGGGITAGHLTLENVSFAEPFLTGITGGDIRTTAASTVSVSGNSTLGVFVTTKNITLASADGTTLTLGGSKGDLAVSLTPYDTLTYDYAVTVDGESITPDAEGKFTLAASESARVIEVSATEKVIESDAVAAIGSEEYDTLAEAFAAAQTALSSGDVTVTVKKDAPLTAAVTIGGANKLTVEAEDKTITLAAAAGFTVNGPVEFKGITLDGQIASRSTFAFIVSANKSLTLTDTSVKNMVYTGGYGVINGGTGSTVSITGGEISGNKSKGGALYLKGTNTLTDVTVSNNESTANGGAVFVVTGGTLSVTGGSFTNNKAATNGGAIYLGDAAANNAVVLTVDGTTFMGNSATGMSGAIFALVSAKTGTVSVKNATFSGNTSTNKTRGVGIGAGHLTLENVTFVEPFATGITGGDIRTTAAATLTLKGTNVLGVLATTTKLTLAGDTDVTLAGNKAALTVTVSGYASGDSVTVNGSPATVSGGKFTVAASSGETAISFTKAAALSAEEETLVSESVHTSVSVIESTVAPAEVPTVEELVVEEVIVEEVLVEDLVENIIDEAPAEELPAAEEVPAAAEVPVTEALPVQEESALPVETAEEAAV
ncbi:MAG: hypothetical protein IIX99_02835, partial [Oscillospiraceae bacterium]|nr:hypothetical protein [Oscillospiraceae bacterium]